MDIYAYEDCCFVCRCKPKVGTVTHRVVVDEQTDTTVVSNKIVELFEYGAKVTLANQKPFEFQVIVSACEAHRKNIDYLIRLMNNKEFFWHKQLIRVARSCENDES